METPPRLSASVIAAAVIAIMSSLFLLLCFSAVFFALLLNAFPGSAPEFPPVMRTLTLATMGFLMCLSAFGIATGIGLILLRKWARISVLIWSSFCVFFSAFGMPVAILMPLAPSSNGPQLTAESMQAMRWIMVAVYGLPLAIGIWWLILFNRKSVKEQFSDAAKSAESGIQEKPRCPLPIAVLAWFYITSVANFIFLPLMPFRVPIFVFGRVLSGNIGVTVLVISCLLIVVCGVGLLKLKPWSYSLTLVLHVFWLASTVVSLLSPKYNAVMDAFISDIQESLHLPSEPFSASILMHHHGWSLTFALLVSGGILGLLIFYRSRFLEAASAAASA